MDERHWWFTSKVLQTFHLGLYDDPTLLEDFMANDVTVQKLNDFFSTKGEQLIFFYVSKSSSPEGGKILQIGTSATEHLYKLLNDVTLGVFFIREDTTIEIDVNNVEQQVFSGEIKEDGILFYDSIIKNIFISIIQNKEDWKECRESDQNEYIHDLEKYSRTLTEYSNTLTLPTQILNIPDGFVVESFRKNRQLASNPQIVAKYEALVYDWAKAIEPILLESLDDKFDLYTTPMSMLSEWKRRQRLIQGILNQLRAKEIKSVIAVLISAKSKALKRWKVIDSGLTDTFNDIKDKTKFLESFRRTFEALQQDATLFQLSNTVLPDFFSGLKQFESVSKFYAKNGFLGSLLAKISQHLATVCEENICKFVHTFKEHENPMWYCISSEVTNGRLPEKNKISKRVAFQTENSLLSVLHNILSLCNQYEEMLRSLRDAVGTTSQFPQISGLYLLSKKLLGGAHSNIGSDTELSSRKPSVVKETLESPTEFLPDETEQSSESLGPSFNCGVALSDEKTILFPVYRFTHYVHELLDIIETLKQLHRLIESTKGLPRINRKELSLHDLTCKHGTTQIQTVIVKSSSDMLVGGGENFLLSFSQCLHNGYNRFVYFLRVNLTLPLFTDGSMNSKAEFDQVYAQFIKSIQAVEKYTQAYVENVFDLDWDTRKMLHILSCFEAVISRTALTSTFDEVYSRTLTSFNDLLDGIEEEYNEKKADPPCLRNSPMVSSTVYWVRSLFRRIEHCMNELKTVKSVTQLKKYPTVVKQYNRLATVLIQFEESWLSIWHSQAENINKFMNTTLLAIDVTSEKIFVYADPRILEIFADVKLLRRIGVPINNNILDVSSQESKFKFYKQTLDGIVRQYYEICNKIPEHLQEITKPLCQSTLAYFQPGLSVLKWDSVNIDAFLFKVQQALDHFQNSIMSVVELCTTEIDTNIDAIKDFILFDKTMLLKWNPTDFLSTYSASSGKLSMQLNEYICTVERSLQQITTILIRNHSANSINPNQTHQKRMSKADHSYASSLLANAPQETVSMSPISISDEKKVVSNLYSHYALQIYQAMKTSTAKSLEEYSSWLKNALTSGRNSISFCVSIVFFLPHVLLEPQLNDVQYNVSKVAEEIINISLNIYWWDVNQKKTFYEAISNDAVVMLFKTKINSIVTDLENEISSSLLIFDNFKFLWADDMHVLYRALEDENVELKVHHNEVERIMLAEKNIEEITDEMRVGCILLDTTPVKDSMRGFCLAWKMCYVQKLHQVAKKSLDEIVAQQEGFSKALTSEIVTLYDLNSVLQEIHKVSDLENEIDDMYTPVEILYEKLNKTYGIPIARDEIETVENLRNRWSELVLAAEQANQNLMRERRTVFEQELDKNVKTFVVEVIQFRNRFDSQGPGIPGLSPNEAVARLLNFQEEYKKFDKKKEMLHAVQLLYGLSPTPFIELDKTGEELELLGMLYDLFQKYIQFDEVFRDTLWADADLENCNEQIKDIWELCMNLPSTIHHWFAFRELKEALNNYLDLFPILHQLASKEIRNRHWLQVMQVTKKSFQLEANIFKLNHIMDIGFLKHKTEIDHIFQSSQAELDLEVKLRRIEEEWTEQVIKFVSFKGRGVVAFDTNHMNNLLDSLEDGKTALSVMLTSKFIKPLREETAAWAVKLNDIGEVIEQWLKVEQLWMNLEAVFVSETIMKSLPQQFANFAQADRSYIRLMKKSVETANVLQCCLGGEVSVIVTLKQIIKDLELCFKELNSYLTKKRKVFPRFNFVPDMVLLSMLSKPYNVESVLPHIREIISGVHNVETVSDESRPQVQPKSSVALDIQPVPVTKRRSSINSASARDSRFAFLQSKDKENSTPQARKASSHSEASTLLTVDNTDWLNHLPMMHIVSVVDHIGEKLKLRHKVKIEGEVEQWLCRLLQEMKTSVNHSITTSMNQLLNNGTAIEDIILSNLCQTGFMAYLTFWSNECRKSISEIRQERKSYINLAKRFQTVANRLSSSLIKGIGRNNAVLTKVQKLRLQAVIGISLYLRDIFDESIAPKIRDISDFEWRIMLKCFFNENEKSLKIRILDKCLSYHNEFIGCNISLVMSPITDRCFLNMFHALDSQQSCCISGDALCGKKELVKGFSHLLGQHLLTIDCMTLINLQILSRIFVGIAEDGSWCLFKSIHYCSNAYFSLLHYHIGVIQQCLKAKMEKVVIHEHGEISVLPTCGIFLTSSLPFIHKECPASFKVLFRNVSITTPDNVAIMRAHLVREGFRQAKQIAAKINIVSNIAQRQLKSSWNMCISVFKIVMKCASRKLSAFNAKQCQQQDMETKARDSPSVSQATVPQSAGTRFSLRYRNMSTMYHSNTPILLEGHEFNFIVQSLDEVLVTRLSDQDSVVLKSILKSVFGVSDDTNFNMKCGVEDSIQHHVGEILNDLGYTQHQPFIDKIMQLYKLSQIQQSIIICGPSQSGKTSCLNILLDALQKISDEKLDKTSAITYRQEHLNVLAVSSLDSMFGYIDGTTGSWNDGIFTSLLKKSIQYMNAHKISTWITLDGPVRDAWTYRMKSLFGDTKMLVQSDLEQHYLTKHVTLLYETDNLVDASPSIFPMMGILYVDSSVLGWRAIASAFLEKRPSGQYHEKGTSQDVEVKNQALHRAFHKTVDRLLLFVQEEAQMCVQISDTALFSSCLNMLGSLLNEYSDVSSDTYLERLYVFSLIWTFGGLLVTEWDRIQFNILLLSLTRVLPDDDHGISAFDYFVDESGEWDTWDSRMNEVSPLDSVDIFGDVYVETQATVRTRFLLELFLSSHQDIVIVGRRCSGKTSMIMNILRRDSNKSEVIQSLTFSQKSDATSMQAFIESHIHHRQESSSICDVPQEKGTSQDVDVKNQEKGYFRRRWRQISGFRYGARSNKRLKLFIDDLHLPNEDICHEQSANQLLHQLVDRKVIYSSNGSKPKYIEGLNVLAAMNTYGERLKSTKAKYSRLLGRFNVVQLPQLNGTHIKSVSSTLLETYMTHNQGLSLPQAIHQRISEASADLLTILISIQNNKVDSIHGSFLFSLKDLACVFQMLQRCPEEQRVDEEEDYLEMFWYHEIKRIFSDKLQPHDKDYVKNKIEQLLKKQSILHQRIGLVDEITPCIEGFIKRYSNERNEILNISMHDFNFQQILKAHRALSADKSANLIFVSWESESMENIVKLVSFMLAYQIVFIDCSSLQTFLHGLRLAVQMAGCDLRNVVVCFKDSQLANETFLDAIHSLMSLGEYPSLFNENELYGLLVALRPTIKKNYPNFLNDPRRFLANAVRKYLHFVIITTPAKQFMDTLHRGYPAIPANSYVIQLVNTNESRLLGEAGAHLKKSSFWSSLDDALRNRTIRVFEGIHTAVTQYASSTESTDASGDAKKSMKPPKPSKVLRAKLVATMQSSTNSLLVNIFTYKRFLSCFVFIMSQKIEEVHQKEYRRQRALSYLQKAEEKAKEMIQEKRSLDIEYETIDRTTFDICEELFAKSALIERLKAKYGCSSGSFRDFIAMIDQELCENEEEFSFHEEKDEYDEQYDMLQSVSKANLKTLDEQISEQEETLKVLQEKMENAKEILSSFQVQIDRGCIERLRAYQSPPALVGTVMVMLMVLLGRPEFSSHVVNEKKVLDVLRNENISPSRSRTSSGKSRRPKEVKIANNVGAAPTPDGKVDRATWKTIQQIMQDSQKFCDLMNTYNWVDGLSTEVLQVVIKFFAPGEEIPVYAREDNNQVSSTTPLKDDRSAGISLQAARFSSEDAAQIVEYVQKVIDFTRKYKPYLQTTKDLEHLKNERREQEEKMRHHEEEKTKIIHTPVLEEEDPLLSLTDVDIPRLQDELNQLQSQFDEYAIKKNTLQQKIKEFSNLLNATIGLLDSMKPLKASWISYCEQHKEDSTVLISAILIAANISYCSSYNTDKRQTLMKEFINVLKTTGFDTSSIHPDQGYVNPCQYLCLATFLNLKNEMKHLQLICPSVDDMLLNTYCMLENLNTTNSWPLLCDPNSVGCYLLKKIFTDITILSYENMDVGLEKAVQSGSKVLLLDVDLKTISQHPRLWMILKSYSKFKSATTGFKLTVNEKEIDCSPDFRLLMMTPTSSNEVPLDMSVYVHAIEVSPSRKLLYEIFLSYFMLKEKSQIEESLQLVNKEILNHQATMYHLEDGLLKAFDESDCFENIVSIKKLLNTRKQYEDARQSLSRAEEAYETIRKSREVYEPIAMKAAILFETTARLRKLNPLYQISLSKFLSYFGAAIKHSERSAVSVVSEKVLSVLFYTMSKRKLEEDRHIFALYTALEIEDYHGRVAYGDREFIINPRYGAAVRQACCSRTSSSQQKSNVKKPFDWMADEQFLNLLNLSSEYDWFTDAFEKMAKDGREMQWRQIAEHDTPEVLSLPDNLDDKYTPLQRLMVIRAFRPDRLLQASLTFISNILGKRLASDPALELKTFHQLSSPSTPVLMLYEKEALICEMLLNASIEGKQIGLLSYDVSGHKDDELAIQSLLNKAAGQTSWLYLANIHHNPSLMQSLFTQLQQVKCDPIFRVWLSADVAAHFSPKFLKSCLCVVIDSAKLNLHKSLIENLQLVRPNLWKTPRGDWLAVLHNLCMLHACLAQRKICGFHALCDSYVFNFDTTKLMASLEAIITELGIWEVFDLKSDPKPIVWSVLRSILMKVVYGREVTNETDFVILQSIIENWISATGTRRDFEISKVRYKLPTVIFTTNVYRNMSVPQLVENVQSITFDSTEFSGLFYTAEIQESINSKCLTSLKRLYEDMPQSKSLVHANPEYVYPTCLDAGADPKVLLHQNLISWVKYCRRIEIKDSVTFASAKMPRLWNKDFISERIRKTGGVNPFNMWLLNEADSICVLHFTVKTALQKVQEVLSNKSDYWSISDTTKSDCIALFRGGVPQRWCDLAGPSSPPNTWGLVTWINDFQQRCSHIEKILLLGREKMACYWLAAFFNPKRLIAIITQELCESTKVADALVEKLNVRAEITSRDKDHVSYTPLSPIIDDLREKDVDVIVQLRDPAIEGIFVHGLHLWGAHWEKATNDIHDAPPKSNSYALPVVHFTLSLPTDKPSHSFSTPCFSTRRNRDEKLMNVDIDQKDGSNLKMAFRGVTCTLRHF